MGERPEEKSHEILGWLLGLSPLTQVLFTVSVSQAEQTMKRHFLQGNPSVTLSSATCSGQQEPGENSEPSHNETLLSLTGTWELKTPSPSKLVSDGSRMQDMPRIAACLLCAYAHFHHHPPFYSLSPAGSRTL